MPHRDQATTNPTNELICPGPAADHHLIDVAPDEHLTVAVGHGHGIVVAAVTHQRQRTRPSRALIAGIIGSRRQWQENLTIPLETLADGLLVAPQPRRLAPAALFGESIVEGREALGTRDGDQEVPPDEADQSLDLALVVALARPAEPVLEQIVGLKLREDARSLPLAIAQDPGNRQLGVVVQDGSGDAAEEGKRRVVAIAECFGRLRRIGRNKATITVGKVEGKEVDLAVTRRRSPPSPRRSPPGRDRGNGRVARTPHATEAPAHERSPSRWCSRP